MSSKIEEAMFYTARLNPDKNGNDDIVTPFAPVLPFIGRLRGGISSLISTVRHVSYMMRESNAFSGEPQK
jgi:hypothetical protein